MGETTIGENLAGEEAQCRNQSGETADWLHHRRAVCIAGGLWIGTLNNISLRTGPCLM